MTDQTVAFTSKDKNFMLFLLAAVVAIGAPSFYALMRQDGLREHSVGNYYVQQYQVSPGSFSVSDLSSEDLMKIDENAVSGVHLKIGISEGGQRRTIACTSDRSGLVSTFMLVEGVRVGAESNARYVKPMIEAGFCRSALAR